MAGGGKDDARRSEDVRQVTGETFHLSPGVVRSLRAGRSRCVLHMSRAEAVSLHEQALNNAASEFVKRRAQLMEV